MRFVVVVLAGELLCVGTLRAAEPSSTKNFSFPRSIDLPDTLFAPDQMDKQIAKVEQLEIQGK